MPPCSAAVALLQLVAIEGDKQQLMHERGGVVREQAAINGEGKTSPGLICMLSRLGQHVTYYMCAKAARGSSCTLSAAGKSSDCRRAQAVLIRA